MEWVQIVSSVGFPIVAVFGCGWFIKYTTDLHKNEIDKLSEAVNNNTIVMTKLIEKLGGDK